MKNGHNEFKSYEKVLRRINLSNVLKGSTRRCPKKLGCLTYVLEEIAFKKGDETLIC